MSQKSSRSQTSRKGSKKTAAPEAEPEVKLKVYEQVMFERRVLLATTVTMGLAIVVWIVAIATDYWVILDGGEGIFIPENKRYFLYSNSGIWRICRYAFSNGTAQLEAFTSTHSNSTHSSRKIGRVVHHKRCWNHDMFSDVSNLDSSADTTIVEFNKAEGVFSGITLLLMVLGLIFSIYTFKNPRYMFKRTAGGVHFLSMGASFAVIEVLMNSVDYEKKYIPFIYPPGAKQQWGFSFILAWIVFLANLFAGILFMLYSRKRKCKKAATEEMGMADEPTIIGR